MSIERVVVILTPVFAALSGLVTGAVGQLLPGVNLSKADVTALFIAGAVAAATSANHWLHGRQKLSSDLANADKLADHVVAKINANPQAAPALADIEAVLRSHTDQIVQAVGQAVHAPPSVEQVVEAVAKRLTGAPAAVPASSPTGGIAASPPPPPVA